jgi:hypothetical protein
VVIYVCMYVESMPMSSIRVSGHTERTPNLHAWIERYVPKLQGEQWGCQLAASIKEEPGKEQLGIEDTLRHGRSDQHSGLPVMWLTCADSFGYARGSW